MPSVSPQTVKLKSTLRLLIPRLRMAQKKDTAMSVASRREMALLLESNREASARIRVENIIQTDITVELMEILELYAELLLARAGLLDTRSENSSSSSSSTKDGMPVPDTGLEEAAASIIYAAPRLPREVRELGIVRAMLVDRFGKEFGIRAQENRDGKMVPERVVDKLKVEPPPEKLVTGYLEEIARTYGVDWPPHKEEDEEAMADLRGELEGEEDQNHDDDEDDDNEGGGGTKIPIAVETSSTPTPGSKKKSPFDLGRPFERDQLSKMTPPRGNVGSGDAAGSADGGGGGGGGAKSPITIAPPGPRSDNLSPKLKLPGGAGNVAARKKQPPAGIGSGRPSIPADDELARRFQALKR